MSSSNGRRGEYGGGVIGPPILQSPCLKVDPTWSLHKVLYTLYLVTTPLVLQLFLFNLETLQQILTVSHCKVQYFDLRNITPWSNRDHTWCNTKIFNILKSCYPTLILFRASVALNKCSVCAFVLSSQLIMDITKVLLNFGVFYNILSCSRHTQCNGDYLQKQEETT